MISYEFMQSEGIMDVLSVLNENKQRLDRLYAGADQTERYTKLAGELSKRFGCEPEAFVSAPGRTEVIGNHTDHNKGRVLAAAVNLDTLAAVAKRDDGRVVLYSEGWDKPFDIDLKVLAPLASELETTSALIRGVASRMKALGYNIGGFSACVTSTVLKGSGLSSSAAFEVLVVAIFDALYNGWVIDPVVRAEISQYAENVFFGKPCGLMDQTASSVGGLVTIDFLPEKCVVEALQYDFDAKGYDVAVTAAGGDHGNLTNEYAAMPAEMKAAAAALGRDVLGDITPEEAFGAISRIKGKVPDRAILRMLHFADENRRVLQAVGALKNDDISSFLDAEIKSGESSWKLLQNLYVPASGNQEMCIALAMSEKMLAGKGAWRIHGGGFAGTILAFVPKELTAEYTSNMEAVFGKGSVTILAIRPEGAVCIK